MTRTQTQDQCQMSVQTGWKQTDSPNDRLQYLSYVPTRSAHGIFLLIPDQVRLHSWRLALCTIILFKKLRLKFSKLPITYTINSITLSFSTKELTPEPTTINCKIILFKLWLPKHFLLWHIVNIWNSWPNSVVDTCTVNALKARLGKF